MYYTLRKQTNEPFRFSILGIFKSSSFRRERFAGRLRFFDFSIFKSSSFRRERFAGRSVYEIINPHEFSFVFLRNGHGPFPTRVCESWHGCEMRSFFSSPFFTRKRSKQVVFLQTARLYIGMRAFAKMRDAPLIFRVKGNSLNCLLYTPLFSFRINHRLFCR